MTSSSRPLPRILEKLKLTRDRMHILSLYTSLHASGVVHNDVEYRHWLRPPGGESSRIRLIDFDCAVVRDRRDEEYGSEWEQLVEGEMARVKSLLGTV